MKQRTSRVACSRVHVRAVCVECERLIAWHAIWQACGKKHTRRQQQPPPSPLTPSARSMRANYVLAARGKMPLPARGGAFPSLRAVGSACGEIPLSRGWISLPHGGITLLSSSRAHLQLSSTSIYTPCSFPGELVVGVLPLGRIRTHRSRADHDVSRLLEAAEDVLLHIRHPVLLADRPHLRNETSKADGGCACASTANRHLVKHNPHKHIERMAAISETTTSNGLRVRRRVHSILRLTLRVERESGCKGGRGGPSDRKGG